MVRQCVYANLRSNGPAPGGLQEGPLLWMRGLLRNFADRGGSVLLSSHLLHEVQVVADDLVVIGHGAVVAQGRKGDLLAEAGGTLVRASDDRALSEALTRAGIEHEPAAEGGYLSSASTADIAKAAQDASVLLSELRTATEGSLEEMFLRLTTDHARHDSTESANR
jgi:ABC-2 type transport system ATP-binding protein